MAKLSLNNLTNLQNETTAVGLINTNNDAIETALEKTLSRDGTSPNQMTAVLDMNSNKIINLPAATANGDAVNYQQFTTTALLRPLIIDTSPITGGTSSGILFNNEGVVGCTDDTTGSSLLKTSGPFQISPPVPSLLQGLVIDQNTPSDTNIDGPYFANQIVGTWTGTLTGSGGPGGDRTMHQLNVQLYTGGSNYDTQSSGAISGVVHHVLNDTSVGDIVGIGGFVNSTATRSLGNIYGGTTGFRCDTGSSIPLGVGFEVDTFIEGTGVAFYRIGINSWQGGTKNATITDSAYGIGASGGVGTVGWKKGITLFTQNGSTNPPLAADADLIYADYAGTVANLINLPTITVTSNIINSPNVILTGAGLLQLGKLTSDGGLVILGGAGSNLATTYYNGASPTWVYGATAGSFYMGAASGPAAAAWVVDHATNVLSTPSGLTVSGDFSINGATSGSVKIKVPAIAGTNIITLPAGTTDFTATGGAGRFVKQNSVGSAFTVSTVAASEIASGAALTKTDDTNVTLTLGGTPASALLTAASLTLGWTGTLAPSRGGTGIASLGTGIATALGINTGSAGAPVLFNGALGTPTSGVATNLTGTASGLTAGSVTTNANLTGDVTSSGNATTLTNAPVIAKVLTGYSASAGTVASTDSILQAFQKIGGLVDNAAWTAYTPTITSSGGTSPTSASQSGRYKVIGKTVFFTAQFQQTNTSGSGALQVSLPFTSIGINYIVNAVDGTAGLLLQGQVTASTALVSIKTSAGLYPGVSGDFFTVSGHYEMV